MDIPFELNLQPQPKANPVTNLPQFADDFLDLKQNTAKEFTAVKRQYSKAEQSLMNMKKAGDAQLAELKATKAKVEVVEKNAKLALDNVDDLVDVVDAQKNEVKKVKGQLGQVAGQAASASATATIAANTAVSVKVALAAIAATVSGLAGTWVLANELRRAINNQRAELQRATDALYSLILTNQQRSIDRDNAISQRVEALKAELQGMINRTDDLLRKTQANTRTITDINGRTLTLERRADTQATAIAQVQTKTTTLTQTLTQLQTLTIPQLRLKLQEMTVTMQQSCTAILTQIKLINRAPVVVKVPVITPVRVPVPVKVPVITPVRVPVPVTTTVTKIVKVPDPYPVPQLQVVRVPQPYQVTNTRTFTHTHTRTNTFTNTITKTQVKTVPVPIITEKDKTTIVELTKRGSCQALSGCNPDSDIIRNIDRKLGNPFATPITLINDPEQEGQIEHPSFASIFSWWIKQMDALVGEFPIKLEIEDSDLMRVGDQTLKIEFPNVAEALAELMGLSINNKAVTEANLDATMRTLMEAGSGRKQGIVTHHLLEAIQDYLGFSSRQRIISVPFSYNPIDAVTTDKIGDALNESEQLVKVEQNADLDTLEKRLAAIMEAARIIKSVHFRKLSPQNVEEWKAMMKESRGQVRDERRPDEKDDFDEFLENVEEGWTAITGNDPTQPYDRNREERPRIRRLKPDTDGGSQ